MSTTMFPLDPERPLRFDYDAIDRINALPSSRRGGRNPIQLWGDTNGLDFGAMAILAWAGSKHDDPSAEWTIDRCAKEIRRAMKLRGVTFKQLNDAINEAMSGSETIGLGQPRPGDDDDEAEAAEGNRTRPTPGRVAIAAVGPTPIESPSGSAD